ncbi:zinc finger and SCAN domain-containing protein 31-like isoform X2 [Aricia agestis]|uniref:zinc finger and SCAN domain-containing protein 31-like isoform X2 n=1 Tax=Aricia agestis TaxID=91739 RepID=UPI001C2036D6|nr:zinc finger and SCAN domain-containing protein 31-like isoform X2 [Aricia agestis]
MDAQLGKKTCEEDSDMNFAAFSSAGTHFVTTGSQLPVTKIQQNVSNNGSLSQVVGMVGNMGEGMQYVRTIDGSSLQNTPQLITVPISLPGAKPGDPQPTVQIQVLGPNIQLQQQQQPKYQMQIPIQGFQQGSALLTLAYSPENIDNGLLGLGSSSLPEGLQLLTMPQEMQMQHRQQDIKEEATQNVHQVFITPDQQIVISGPNGQKILNNNTSSDNNNSEITIKEEVCIEDESSQGTETSDVQWQIDNPSPDLVKYLNSLAPQQAQQLPPSLQQFLRLNPADIKKDEAVDNAMDEDRKDNITEAIVDEDGNIHIQSKKKKKYKRKPPKPAAPKPGQVIITTALDGTPLWCCPECQMAFPEKGELEAHLSVHKIERRFICGICGAGLKRKEHLERHKLGHNPERPYGCGVCGKAFKRREHLNLHTVIHSGVKTELCGECGKGFYRKDHLRKHMRSHLTRRAREEVGHSDINKSTAVLPEITIHVPSAANMPVQINIPQHVMSSLAAGARDESQLPIL